MGYSKKHPRYTFTENPTENFKFAITITLRNSKQGFTPTPRNSAELCGTSGKFQGQKPKDPWMEIPQTAHEFFLKTRNSTSFLVHPWNFHIMLFYFFNTP